MKLILGRQIEGRTQWVPSAFFFGGCLFINGWRRSAMIPLPDWLVEELAIWGIDTIGD